MKRLLLNDWYRLMSNNIVSSVLKTKEYLQSAGLQMISLKFRNDYVVLCLTMPGHCLNLTLNQERCQTVVKLTFLFDNYHYVNVKLENDFLYYLK